MGDAVPRGDPRGITHSHLLSLVIFSPPALRALLKMTGLLFVLSFVLCYLNKQIIILRRVKNISARVPILDFDSLRKRRLQDFLYMGTASYGNTHF